MHPGHCSPLLCPRGFSESFLTGLAYYLIQNFHSHQRKLSCLRHNFYSVNRLIISSLLPFFFPSSNHYFCFSLVRFPMLYIARATLIILFSTLYFFKCIFVNVILSPIGGPMAPPGCLDNWYFLCSD